jgi:molybdate transport system substrate-binding protein
MSLFVRCAALILGLAGVTAPVRADDVRIAVAANFRGPMLALAREFELQGHHRVAATYGGSGKFYAQIREGAPFDVLLSADQKIPQQLEKDGLAVAGTRFTYAVGRLALWSARTGLVDGHGEILRSGNFRHIALANPALAPYGVAAIETLNGLGLYAELRPKIVQGEDIAQTAQFVATESAELGFLALSQVYHDHALTSGSAWIVPENLHAPIRQDAVLLKPGQSKAAAREFLEFLTGTHAKEIVAGYGYGG